MTLNVLAHKGPNFGTAKIVKILQTASDLRKIFNYFRPEILKLTTALNASYKWSSIFFSNIFDTSFHLPGIARKGNIGGRKADSGGQGGTPPLSNALLLPWKGKSKFQTGTHRDV